MSSLAKREGKQPTVLAVFVAFRSAGKESFEPFFAEVLEELRPGLDLSQAKHSSSSDDATVPIKLAGHWSLTPLPLSLKASAISAALA